MAHETLSRLDPHPGTSVPQRPDFDQIIAILWTPLTPDRCMGWAKMTPYHHPTCVTSVWVRSVPKVSITVVLTTKRVTKKPKK